MHSPFESNDFVAGGQSTVVLVPLYFVNQARTQVLEKGEGRIPCPTPCWRPLQAIPVFHYFCAHKCQNGKKNCFASSKNTFISFAMTKTANIFFKKSLYLQARVPLLRLHE